MGDQTSVVEYSLSLAGNDNEKPMKSTLAGRKSVPKGCETCARHVRDICETFPGVEDICETCARHLLDISETVQK